MTRHIKTYEVSKANNESIEEFIGFKKAQKGNTISGRTLTNIKENLRKLTDYLETGETKQYEIKPKKKSTEKGYKLFKKSNKQNKPIKIEKITRDITELLKKQNQKYNKHAPEQNPL